MPKQKRARGRPKKNWMEGIKKAMNERNLNEGQWEDRKRWSLGVGQRRQTFWNRYIHTYILLYMFVGVLKTSFIHFYLEFWYFLFEVFRLCIRYAVRLEARYVCGARSWCPRAVPPLQNCFRSFRLLFSPKVFCLVAFTRKYYIARFRMVPRCVPDDGECGSISGSAGNKHL
jgi:hypothetical protein